MIRPRILARPLAARLAPRLAPRAPALRLLSTLPRTPSGVPPSFFTQRRPALAPALTSSLALKRFISIRFGPSPEFSARHPAVALLIRLALSSVLGLAVLTGAILFHDAFTYSERHVDRVPTNALSLHPRRGGKKNLPIIEANLDDEEDDQKRAMKNKPKLVIIGGGWGAVALIQSLSPNQYNVTLVSPQTYFAFTPLLPSACVGTVEVRSLVEPLRKLIARVRGHYLMGSAVDVDMAERLLEVEVPDDEGKGVARAYLPYDKLVIACGSTSNDHGVKGLEHCFQLKTVPDAQAIRRRVMANLELASLPTTTPEERKRLLSFVVCGGGPTGVEFAAELSDMLNEDVLDYFPKALRNEISVHVVQSRDHILNTYSEKISQYAEKRFARSQINVVTNARVSEVTPEKVVLSIKDPKDKNSKPRTVEIDSGFVLWSTGIAMQPFTKRLVDILPNQFHSKAVQVDSYLRVEGAPKGTVYAMGDAATIHLNMLDQLLEIWDKFDTNKDGAIDYEEWQHMSTYIKKQFPLASKYFDRVKDIFDEYDKDKDEKLGLNEVAAMFQDLSKKVTALPATAQVASQEGKYLGHMFNKLARQSKVLRQNDMPDLDDEAYFDSFKYKHLGSLAYIGNSAVIDVGDGWSFAGGLLAMYAWRSVYWSEQASLRLQFLLMIDWIKRGIFGRDLSKF
ncbi:hypothetical protein Q5752_005943 [Cryptotrichosporon argae]